MEITREVARLSEQAERRFGIRCADRGAPCGWRIWTPPKMTCTGWPPTRPRGYLVSHRGRPLIEAAETRGRDGKVVPIGIVQEKTPVWRGAGRPKAKSTRRIRTWNWGRQMAFVPPPVRKTRHRREIHRPAVPRLRSTDTQPGREVLPMDQATAWRRINESCKRCGQPCCGGQSPQRLPNP